MGYGAGLGDGHAGISGAGFAIGDEFAGAGNRWGYGMGYGVAESDGNGMFGDDGEGMGWACGSGDDDGYGVGFGDGHAYPNYDGADGEYDESIPR